ncbi:MAG: AraC-like DNA-binding protein [Parvicellaceae bacterium]|jgi:AraC-like DNA-binding protein
MEVITLSLRGRPFIQSFSLESDFRANQVRDHDACLSYVCSGTQEIFSPTGKIVTKDGEGVLMKCGNYVAGTVGATPISAYHGVAFHMNLETIKKAFAGKDLGFLKVSNNVKMVDPSVKISQNKMLENFISSLTFYFECPELAKEEILALKLQELVYILCDSGKNPIATQIIGTLETHDQIAFDEIISANLFSGLSLNELAHLTARSESSFKRDFRKWYQESPAKYFKIKRLEKAADLLKHSKLQVNEIAWDCGFESAAHFGAAFLASHGKTPKQFRA